MKKIYIKDLMTRTVSCQRKNTPLREVVRLMVENSLSCVIIEQDGEPFGIITERDLVKILHADPCVVDMSDPVSAFMTSPILRLKQDESLFDALVVSKAERVRHLPVVDDSDKLVGLLTQSDLADAHFHVYEQQAEIIEEALAEKIQVLQTVNDDLHALCMEDHLLEIGNRRAMEVDLLHIHAGAVRYKSVYSVLLVDVDNFRSFNDHYGHLLGDDVLKRIARVLKVGLRAADRIYRYSSTELLVILPHLDEEHLKVPAAKLVAAVAALDIPHDKSVHGKVTISIGGACVITDGSLVERWEMMVQLAGQCLYGAKQDGQNRYFVAG